ncbi:hypothetical protein V1280_003017 [Bradyrhizobium sp. AZCC 2230]
MFFVERYKTVARDRHVSKFRVPEVLTLEQFAEKWRAFG